MSGFKLDTNLNVQNKTHYLWPNAVNRAISALCALKWMKTSFSKLMHSEALQNFEGPEMILNVTIENHGPIQQDEALQQIHGQVN